MSWNSLCRPGWPQIHKRSACFCLLSAEIKGVHHYTQLSVCSYFNPTTNFLVLKRLGIGRAVVVAVFMAACFGPNDPPTHVGKHSGVL